jgi:hypothetical protein
MTVKKIKGEIELLRKENDTHTIYEDAYRIRILLEKEGLIPARDKCKSTGSPLDRDPIIYLIGKIQTDCGNASREYPTNLTGYTEKMTSIKRDLGSLSSEVCKAFVEKMPE